MGRLTSLSSSTARIPSSIRRRDRTRTTSPRASTSAAAPRRAWAATTRTALPAAASDGRRRPDRPRRVPGAYPWLGYDGRWGEEQPGFYNGPTGPEHEAAVDGPILWANTEWRDTSFAIPAGSHSARAIGLLLRRRRRGLRRADEVRQRSLAGPARVRGARVLLLWLASRTRWDVSAPFPPAPPAAVGLAHHVAWRLYRGNLACSCDRPALPAARGLSSPSSSTWSSASAACPRSSTRSAPRTPSWPCSASSSASSSHWSDSRSSRPSLRSRWSSSTRSGRHAPLGVPARAAPVRPLFGALAARGYRRSRCSS